jgi:hypothetical protein
MIALCRSSQNTSRRVSVRRAPSSLAPLPHPIAGLPRTRQAKTGQDGTAALAQKAPVTSAPASRTGTMERGSRCLESFLGAKRSAVRGRFCRLVYCRFLEFGTVISLEILYTVLCHRKASFEFLPFHACSRITKFFTTMALSRFESNRRHQSNQQLPEAIIYLTSHVLAIHTSY